MTGLSVEIDRSSPVPLYFQVAQHIEREIEEGRLAPGARLDNEIQLADQLGLSRPTMRRAIQELVNKGLLVRKRGVGTQVVHGQIKRPVKLTSLFDDLTRANQRPRTEVLAHDAVAAPDSISVELNLRPGDTVVRLKRLRWAADEPLAIMHNWLPAELCPFSAQRLSELGLYPLLRSSGVNMRVAKQRIGARAATAEEARLLGVKRGAAVLTMTRTAFDDSGDAVEFGDHIYRSDSYSFEVTLVDQP
ncbi:GntR family transcriptional regulator [Allonocardiopsis opalescens]|uniref:GntR family transcriptional regulator n=1 Tax=Allonocardiopsis opalescens TaxID=1144618 RepID=A0A2T0PV74_9ACTN|nr:GntR family transcriptional regulator [Allonocardiopsis opalescens]PRX95429.1 GntR family transcriptional regulator [Allonocardiopsis opalescens]